MYKGVRQDKEGNKSWKRECKKRERRKRKSERGKGGGRGREGWIGNYSLFLTRSRTVQEKFKNFPLSHLSSFCYKTFNIFISWQK